YTARLQRAGDGRSDSLRPWLRKNLRRGRDSFATITGRSSLRLSLCLRCFSHWSRSSIGSSSYRSARPTRMSSLMCPLLSSRRDRFSESRHVWKSKTQGDTRMPEVSLLRLYMLRGMYLLIAVGLGVTVWPLIVSPPETAANASTVIRSLLGALAVLSLLGV